jgi:hypothetical protein
MTMSKRTVLAISIVSGVTLLALCIAVPAVLDAANEILKKLRSVLPFIPLLLYGILAIVTKKYLRGVPRDATVMALDRPEANSLTLTGFCFTSLSFLLAFFKDEIKKGDNTPEGILLFFAVALGCFIASYMALRYRTKNFFIMLNEAFLDNGIWCVLVGFWTFFNANQSLRPLVGIFTVFIVLYFLYLLTHFIYSISYARQVISGT